MSDSEKCILQDLSRPSVSRTQVRLFAVAVELKLIDRELRDIVEGFPEPDGDFHIFKELRAAADCVRTDLLADAIETLDSVAQGSPISLWRRFEERRTWLVRGV